jgi:hypothetical protein
MTTWAAAGKFKFGKITRKNYWAAVKPSHPTAGYGYMAWMNHVHFLRTVTDRLRHGLVQEEP